MFVNTDSIFEKNIQSDICIVGAGAAGITQRIGEIFHYKNNIKEIKLDSINDTKKFETNSIQILYSLPINSFTLIANNENDVFIAKTVQYEENNINKNPANFEKISLEEGAQSKNNILKSYDLFLNNRYQVVVNEKTLERVKNYFK